MVDLINRRWVAYFLRVMKLFTVHTSYKFDTPSMRFKLFSFLPFVYNNSTIPVPRIKTIIASLWVRYFNF